MLFGVYIRNYVANLKIVTELPNGFYRIVCENFLMAYPKIKSYIRHYLQRMKKHLSMLYLYSYKVNRKYHIITNINLYYKLQM